MTCVDLLMLCIVLELWPRMKFWVSQCVHSSGGTPKMTPNRLEEVMNCCAVQRKVFRDLLHGMCGLSDVLHCLRIVATAGVLGLTVCEAQGWNPKNGSKSATGGHELLSCPQESVQRASP
jgi:hypothetical protein